MGQSVRLVTATSTLNGSEKQIVFNSATPITFNLGPAFGDGREFKLKNIGVGLVTLLPYGSEVIFAQAEENSKLLYTGESATIIDYEVEKWAYTSYEFEITPLSEGGTGIEVSGVSQTFYVDVARTDTYTADGSILRPFKTIQAAIDLATTLTAIRVAADTYAQAVYTIDVAAGIYSANLTVGKIKNLTFRLRGAYITGNIAYDSGSVGGSADNYYSRLEFIGVAGNRPEKGAAGRITGTITGVRANDSLTYVSFSGMDLKGNIAFNTNGTWVVAMHNCFFGAILSAGDLAIVLLETTGHNIFSDNTTPGKIAAAADGTSVTAVSLYNCDNTEFALINISNPAGSRVTNCTFKAATAVTITAGTLALDANSYKTLLASNETLTGCTLSHLDNIGVNPSPCGARTAGAIVATATVNDNIDALDAAIGFEAQMSGTPKTITKTATVFQNLDALDTYKSVQTIKKTIGGIGITADFNFVTAENTVEQIIDLGAILPAKSRLVDIFLYTDAVFTGATTLVADVGTSSGGNELIGSATIYATDAIIAAANAGAFIATPSASAQHIYVNATPGANWSGVTAGKVSVYVTYINVANI